MQESSILRLLHGICRLSLERRLPATVGLYQRYWLGPSTTSQSTGFMHACNITGLPVLRQPPGWSCSTC
ncbi:hypothetical protein EYF80_036818 [Liparis tanakae]|uniref:Uncharacterized protein n=1 Tax=Liparis tanakae TaxID=230148 RepID=A0A4Z2GJ96_9TELE|nr:hypothetical protein EYF80_036818 [Liparis tanakae]